MKYPRKHGERNERITDRPGAERNSWPKRDRVNKNGEIDNEVARRAKAVHQPMVAKGRRGRHKNLTDVTPPPELGDNLNA